MPTTASARPLYAGADPIHDFDHVLRVYHMAERLAAAEGADVEIVRAAALLHDAQKAAPDGDRSQHHRASAELAREILTAEGWSSDRIEAVLHCIRAHRFRDTTEPPATIEAKCLFDADKLDVLGAIGVARTVGYAAIAGEPAYAEPSARFMATGEKEPGEPHSSYHEYLFKLSKVKDRLHTAAARAIAAERHRAMAEFYERLRAEMRGEL